MGPARTGEPHFSEREIKSIVQDEVKSVESTVLDAIERQNVILDKVADSAQATLLSTIILHGNPQMGLKGAIPDLQERMTSVESEVRRQSDVGDHRHEANLDRFRKIESNQNRMRRVFTAFYKWLSSGEEGKTHRHWVWVVMATAMTWLLTFAADHLQWYWVRKLQHIFAR